MIIEITIVINMTTMAVLIPVIMTITVMIKNNKDTVNNKMNNHLKQHFTIASLSPFAILKNSLTKK